MGTTVGIIVAAGRGERMGTPVRKPYLQLGARPILAHTLAVFEECRFVDGYYLVIRAGDHLLFQQRVSPSGPFVKLLGLVEGGSTRQDSVFNGLKHLDPDTTDFVVVHDAVRPFVTCELIARVLKAAHRQGAALPALPVTDTIKEVADGFVRETLERGSLEAVQTPQAFAYPVLRRAYERAASQALQATDSAQLLEALGRAVAVVEGDPANIKLTTPQDLEAARTLISGSAAPTEAATGRAEKPRSHQVPVLTTRVGVGYDVHAFAKDRPLILGGVGIPHELGLSGHSDADVATHAVCDALLGAAGQGDIGRHFPSTDDRYRNANSLELLRQCVAKLEEAGWLPLQVDITIAAQRPRLAQYLGEMRHLLAGALGVAEERVNVKATTTDGLGFVGREEGIAAHAVAVVGIID